MPGNQRRLARRRMIPTRTPSRASRLRIAGRDSAWRREVAAEDQDEHRTARMRDGRPGGSLRPGGRARRAARPTPVMLLQGIVRSRFSLGRMARGLADAGFEVDNLGGPSPRLPLEVQVARFRRDLERLGRELSRLHDGEPPVMHGVGHSMGGVVLRVALAQADSIVPGRVVAIATPFLGTRIAEVVCQRRIVRLVLGAALRDLTWHSAAIRRLATSAGEEPAGGVILGQRGFSRSCRPPGSTRGSASRTRTARSSLPPPAVTGCGRRPPTSSPSAPATRSWPKGPR